ncbi:MAG: hypothetical protein H6Q30_2678 [Bacteroidetes bacterium]|jgi:hypothetical protein|nr:hypothetical protein [Bacteroidota bacterium]
MVRQRSWSLDNHSIGRYIAPQMVRTEAVEIERKSRFENDCTARRPRGAGHCVERTA